MKEGKKNIAKRKVSSSASSKKVVPKNQTPKMPAKHEEPPKVKKIEVEEINKDFDDVENEDRRLIVFIAIAILVIVGTVIGLLVGCEKKNKTPEPEKPGTDVIVPEKPDKKDDKDEGVVTREIIRKVRAVYTGKKTKKNNKGKKDKEEETVTYNVTYYLGEETNVEEVESGKKPPKYVPTGYSVCRYYKNSDLTEDYDMDQAIKSNVNIYMDCDAITYTIVYDTESNNPSEYDVTQGEVALGEPLGYEGYFNGWYSDPEFSNKVTSLSKSVVEFADDNNTIYLYAYITAEPIEEPVDEPTEGETTDDDSMTISDDNRLDAPDELDEEITEPDVIDEEEKETDEEEIITIPDEITDDEEDKKEETEEVIEGKTEEVEEETTVSDDTEEEVTPPVVVDDEEEKDDEETVVTTEPQAPTEDVTEPKEEVVEDKPVVEEVKPEVEDENPVVEKEEPKVEEAKPEVKEETKEEAKETKVEETKPEVKEEPKEEEKKPEVKEEAKEEVKETKVEEKKAPEVKVEKPQKEAPKPEPKPEVKEEPKEEVKEEVKETTEEGE